MSPWSAKENISGRGADYDMIEDLDAEGPGGKDEVPGDFPITEGGLGVAARVVVAEDEGGRIVEQGRLHHLAGVDRRRVDGPDGVEFGGDELVFGVEVEHDEGFPVGVADGGADSLGGLSRGRDGLAVDDGGGLGNPQG